MPSRDPTKYFEDYEPGETHEFGTITVTKEDIVEFAERYDPQPFHVDEGAARDSIFGELVASGWHTVAICTRLLVDGPLQETASAGARGVDALRWHKPVRPGDELSLRVETIEKRPARDVPGIGYVDAGLTGLDQHDEPVVSWTLRGMVERRE